MKKFIAIAMAVLFLLTANVYASTTALKDVDPSEPTYEKIQWAISQGYMKPVLGKFYPQNQVKRGEFAYILSKVTGQNTSLKILPSQLLQMFQKPTNIISILKQ
jgi:S-layer homology domain.